jgi:hypothetical protein
VDDTDGRIAEISEHVCIRGFWHCNAGWGMQIMREPRKSAICYSVDAYYPTLEACIRGEYARVLANVKPIVAMWGDETYNEPSAVVTSSEAYAAATRLLAL